MGMGIVIAGSGLAGVGDEGSVRDLAVPAASLIFGKGYSVPGTGRPSARTDGSMYSSRWLEGMYGNAVVEVSDVAAEAVMLRFRSFCSCSKWYSRRARLSWRMGTSSAQRERHSSALFRVHTILATSSHWFTPWSATACFKISSSISDQRDEGLAACPRAAEGSEEGVLVDIAFHFKGI